MTDEFVLMYGGRVLASGHVREIRALMNEFPHRISIRCDDARSLAQHLLRALPVQGVELAPDHESLAVLTHEPGVFYGGFADVVRDSGVRIRELVSADDSLQSVFHYLIAGD
jgi:ABC-2 type transport system ATP-binding protein